MFASSPKDTHAVIGQTQSEGRSGTAHKEHVTLDEQWRDSGLRGTAGLRQQLVQSLLRHGRTTDLLPSAQSLSRYVRAFLDGFHARYPLFHTQTMPLADMPADIAFSLLAVGADSCLESKAAIYLFESAVATSPTLLGYAPCDTTAVFTTQNLNSTASKSVLSDGNVFLDESSHMLCLMLLLTVFWLENRSSPAMKARWSIQGSFAHELRQSLRVLPSDSQDDIPDNSTSWSEWARRQTQQRMKHAAFCVLDLVSITYDFPVAVPSTELRVAMPCSTAAWHASSADEWAKAYKNTPSKPILLSGLVESLFTGGGDDVVSSSSSVLGSFTVLHAIWQRTQTLRQAILMVPEGISTQIK